MTEKTNTPDEQPDHRATVSTDERSSGVAAEGAAPPAPRPSGATEESAVRASGDPAPRPSDAPTGQMRAAEGGAPRPVPNRPDPAVSGSGAGGPARAGADPAGSNGAAPMNPPPAQPGAPAAQRVQGMQGVQGQRPAGWGGGPVPAPGPVPGPGPAADAPPPWSRAPGPGAPERRESQPAPAGGLLDEVPTAFLEPGRRAAGEGEQTSSDAGGWSSMRAVRHRPPRQAALQLRRLDPWSALKLALVLAVVLFFVWLVAVGVLYGVLDGIGVWDRVNGTYADLVSGETQTGDPLISAGRVFGFAAVIGAINSLLFAVAVTIAAFVYNVSADLVGGIEVTLSERD